MGVNDGLIKNTRREHPILRTTAPGWAVTSPEYSCGLDDVPSDLLMAYGLPRGDSGIEKAESGAPVMICSMSFRILDRATGDILGLI